MKSKSLLKKLGMPLVMLAALTLSGGFLTGCEEGPAEEFGENVDDAADDVGDAFDQ